MALGFQHRVKTSEVPTSLLPPRRISAGIPVVFGTAPVHLLAEGVAKPVNEPVLCYSMAEFQSSLGWSTDFAKYTLCEAAQVIFGLYGMAPIVFINVFDPATHKTGENPDPTKVLAADIIGGVDATTGKSTGLELIHQVFPLFRLVPGTIIAPKYSQDPSVAVVMAAKAVGINSLFKALAICDLPDTVLKYTAAPAYKETNNLTDEHLVVCWPKVSLGGVTHHLSTHLAGLLAFTDGDHGDIPYVSPSNQRLVIDSFGAGTNFLGGLEQSEYLNGQGIGTVLAFDGGLKYFGNRTAAYPSITDPKDAFIPIRRFFNWHGNTFILTYFQKLDSPITRRLIETIVDSEQCRLNGFQRQEIILGGRIVFVSEENPTTDLMDGRIKFHTFLTPPSPAEVIENVLEYDPAYLATLFG